MVSQSFLANLISRPRKYPFGSNKKRDHLTAAAIIVLASISDQHITPLPFAPSFGFTICHLKRRMPKWEKSAQN